MCCPGPKEFLRPATVGLVALVVTTLAGCGAAKGTITGQVKYNGKVVPTGQVTFYSEPDSKDVQAVGIKEGSYTIRDFPAGPVRITVQTVAPGKGNAKLPKGVNLGAFEAAAASDVSQGKGEFVALPVEYGNREKTSLRYTVTAGEQTYDLDLKSKGKTK